MKYEEIPSNEVNSTKGNEQFAIAKFDYNAQKVFFSSRKGKSE